MPSICAFGSIVPNNCFQLERQRLYLLLAIVLFNIAFSIMVPALFAHEGLITVVEQYIISIAVLGMLFMLEYVVALLCDFCFRQSTPTTGTTATTATTAETII
jgi:hypothetical protein